MKVLEFKLPTGSAGMAAGYTRMGINKRLKAVADQWGIKYRTETVGYRFYVEISDRDLTLLALTWTVENPWHRFTLVKNPGPDLFAK